MTLYRCFIDSPIGRLRLLATDEGLVGVHFPEHRHAQDPIARDLERHPILDQARRELGDYFQGRRTTFETPLAPARGTAFQRAVWNALASIPYGQTRSYRDLARQIGLPQAVRAVGAANSRNPISILVACHRVIGEDGSLTGYAGGIETKRWLLDHEAPRR